jgi:hypothetical protein
MNILDFPFFHLEEFWKITWKEAGDEDEDQKVWDCPSKIFSSLLACLG